MRRLRWAICGMAALMLALPAGAHAQPAPRPLPLVVADLRGTIPLLGQSDITAASLGVRPDDLPGRGLGVVAGAHVYPIRRTGFAIGLGGELIWSRASREVPATETEPAGPTIRRRFEGASGQLSFNFGHRDGWSYLSGGIGPLAFDSYDEADSPDGARAMTLNYGGGARWFTGDRMAVGFDVRFYATRPSDPTLVVGARTRQTVMVISVGISVRP